VPNGVVGPFSQSYKYKNKAIFQNTSIMFRWQDNGRGTFSRSNLGRKYWKTVVYVQRIRGRNIEH